MYPPGLGKIHLTQRKILIVEGKEDQMFFSSFLNSIAISDIQVLPIGGKTLLPSSLQALKAEPNFVNVRVLAITRDANSNASSAFRSVCSALSNSNLPVPQNVLQPAGTNPTVKVMIIPPGSSSGKLEDICLQAVANDIAMPCVHSYFTCLLTIPNFIMPNDLSKAKVHTFLSSRTDPDKRLGEAAKAGYWPYNDPVFDPFKDFLSQL